MAHLSINPESDQQGHPITQLTVDLWPNMRNLLDTMVAGADDLRGLVEPLIVRVTGTVAAGSIGQIPLLVEPGMAVVSYDPAQYDVNVTSPLLSMFVFGDNRLWTPFAFVLTASTGTLETTGYEAARRAVLVVIANASVTDAVFTIQVPVLSMTDRFYDKVYRPLKAQALKSMMEMAVLAGGGI